MIIRQCKKEDINNVIERLKEMSVESNYKTMSVNSEKAFSFISNLIDNDRYVAIVEDRGNIVGFMAGDINIPWWSDDTIGIEYGIYIIPEYRNSKIAPLLVSTFISWCKSNNVKQIRVGISTGNDKLSALYIAMGFVRTGDNFLME